MKLNKLEKVLKQYDSFLTHKRHLDGTVEIQRKSPFSTQIKHSVVKLQNQFIGSGDWIRRSLILMDTQKYDITGSVVKKNYKITEEKNDSSMSKEIANFVYENEKVVL